MAALWSRPAVNACREISEVSLKVCRVVHPRHVVDANGCAFLQIEECPAESVDRDVVQKRRQLLLWVPGNGFTYASLRL